jgi:hypothetical protein
MDTITRYSITFEGFLLSCKQTTFEVEKSDENGCI